MVVGGYFSVGFYKYVRPDSLSEWIVVLKVDCGASQKSQSVIEAIAASTHEDPIFLSGQYTYDYVVSVQLQNGVNKKLASSILQVMIPDGTHTTYADTTGSEKMFYINTQHLIIRSYTFNDEDELSIISDM